jgi:hypothetical protein
LQASPLGLFSESAALEGLRTQFGGAEYDRAVKEDGSRRHAEAGLKERTQRVESLNIRPLASVIVRVSWIRGAEFSRGSLTVPVGRSPEADQLLRDVMTTRGYPVTDFEQTIDFPPPVTIISALHFVINTHEPSPALPMSSS